MEKLEVVAAILVYKDKILCMQKGTTKYDYISLKYEFPGGKVEPGESRTEALSRELQEEMVISLDISEYDHFMSVCHEYPDFIINLHCYQCRVNTDAFDMKDHVGFRWVDRNDLDSLDWAPADYPVIQKLMES